MSYYRSQGRRSTREECYVVGGEIAGHLWNQGYTRIKEDDEKRYMYRSRRYTDGDGERYKEDKYYPLQVERNLRYLHASYFSDNQKNFKSKYSKEDLRVLRERNRKSPVRFSRYQRSQSRSMTRQLYNNNNVNNSKIKSSKDKKEIYIEKYKSSLSKNKIYLNSTTSPKSGPKKESDEEEEDGEIKGEDDEDLDKRGEDDVILVEDDEEEEDDKKGEDDDKQEPEEGELVGDKDDEDRDKENKGQTRKPSYGSFSGSARAPRQPHQLYSYRQPEKRKRSSVIDIFDADFMVLDAVGSCDEDSSCDEEQREEQAKEARRDSSESRHHREDVKLGSEHCLLVQVYYCQLCNSYLSKDEPREKSLRLHCSTKVHIENYNSKLKKREKEDANVGNGVIPIKEEAKLWSDIDKDLTHLLQEEKVKRSERKDDDYEE